MRNRFVLTSTYWVAGVTVDTSVGKDLFHRHIIMVTQPEGGYNLKPNVMLPNPIS